jgi:hypothetical protein
MELLESEIAELTTRGIAMMEKLKEVFPEKSGEAQAWNFRKFHDILRDARSIADTSFVDIQIPCF